MDMMDRFMVNIHYFLSPFDNIKVFLVLCKLNLNFYCMK